VWQRIGKGNYREIATNLSVSVGTVSNIMKLFETTGCVDPKVQPSREDLRKLDDCHELYILGLIYDNPALQQNEICNKVEEVTAVIVSGPTICWLLRRNGITRKKIRQVALQRVLRYKSRIHCSFYPVEQLIWEDETGCIAKDCTRKFGYDLKGETPVYHRFLVRGKRVSSIAAMSINGVVTYELTHSTVNGEKFLDFLRGSLIPEMMPHNGSNPKSILGMDNCAIHHRKKLQIISKVLVFF
jgi:transposase